ncbi:MAG TPA: hypothetical protein VJI46_00685 [Candidatus Nanoarchaeia archaeon]|nr:hypothetical protein [Candidatus Nanoarchaeia archaeon]
MGVIKYEFLDDRVRVHHTLQKGADIEDGTLDIFLDQVDTLSKPPESVGLGKNTFEEIRIPVIDKTIVLVIDSYPGNPRGPNEEAMYGPYLKE